VAVADLTGSGHDDGTGAGAVNECREDNNTAPFDGECADGPT